MRLLGLAGGTWICILGIALGSGCSSPAYRDFSVAVPRPATERTFAVPQLIDPSGEPTDLQSLLEPIRARAEIPAMVAVVLQGDRVVARGVVGVRRRGTDVSATIDDQFGIASCAKAMSAVLIARLVEEGKLNWNRPISRYFPAEELHPDWEKISLRHLLSHTAGLRDPLSAFLASAYFDRGTLSERRWIFAEKMLRAGPSAEPRGRMVYCNADYILAAVVAEKSTGQAWEQMMTEKVFGPLGLGSAGFGPPGMPGQTLQPWGHGKYRFLQLGVFGNIAFDPGARTADYPAMASPAGYVHLSINDWAKFVALHLRAHVANPHRQVTGLRPETFSDLHELFPDAGYAGGWFVETRSWAKGGRPEDVGRVMFHLGDNGRWSSAVWIAPEIDFAVLIACNRGDRLSHLDHAVSALVGAYARRQQGGR